MNPNPADWPEVWQRMPQDRRDLILGMLDKYGPLIPGYQPDEPIPSWDAFQQAVAMQGVEVDVLEEHSVWLRKTRALFAKRGWPWTTAELLARSYIREVGE